jgi:hypothetical protein
MNRPFLIHGRKRLKAQASFGNIQHVPTVIPFQLQECKFVRGLSEFLAPVEAYVREVHVL